MIIYTRDINSKAMKLLSFTILALISYSSSAVEFHRCIDDKGLTHYTNLPKSSLDNNCAQQDHYALMFSQDYDNLHNTHQKYENNALDGAVSFKSNGNNRVKYSKPFDLKPTDLSVESVTQKVQDILDPDKALEELMISTEDRDDVFTRAIRGRAKGIEGLLKEN